VVPVFRAVVEHAPKFTGAWAKLIHAETEITVSGDSPEDSAGMKSYLLQDMATARKLNPDMAELLIAEAALLPPRALHRRMELLERAVARNPESPEAAASYSEILAEVGRGYESIERALRAVQLDPLSPSQRDNLITALAYNGQIDAALEELRKAEQLWPGASNLLGARYRVHLRYGDPREAMRIQRLGAYGGPHRDAFLRARIDPSPANIEDAISRPRAWTRHTPQGIGELAQVLGAFGKDEELFAILLNWPEQSDVDAIFGVLFRPALRNFRQDPRMIAVAKRIGLVDYWRKSGKWPDYCREPDLPYDCKAEAAKLG
jgi:tetratricopeptide (TPR) repeat protein